jgi:zinc transporter 5/7
MSSSYALPASAMTHSHSNHGHSHVHPHSHSHSPSRQYATNTSRTLKSERSNGSLHSHPQSESHSDHGHNHSHSHNHYREPSSGCLPTPPNSNGMPMAPFEKQPYESSPALSQLNSYEPPLNAANVIPHGHGHHGHVHTHTSSGGPRSKFTTFLLPFVRKWPLLHTILADKDSRRIFYFMRFVDRIWQVFAKC